MSATLPDDGLAPRRAVAARIGVVLAAAWWALPFFGLIDLSVSVVPDEYPEFAPAMLLETSWGLLFSFLVPLPLLAWAFRPTGWVGPQVVSVAVVLLAIALVAGAWGQVVVALLVAASVAFPALWRPRPRWSVRRAISSPAYWPVDALVAVGLALGVAHAWDVLDLARMGIEDDDTWGLMHMPMQAGLAVAVPVAAAVAVLAMVNSVVGWRFAIVPPVVCAVWFGVVSIRYPDHLASLGQVGGMAAVGWGVLVLFGVWGTGQLPVRQSAAAR